jgi:hypothetical protein
VILLLFRFSITSINSSISSSVNHSFISSTSPVNSLISPVKFSHVTTSTFPVNTSPVNTTHVNCHSETSAQESSPLHAFTSPVNGLFSIKSSIISNHDLSPVHACASHVDTLPVNHSGLVEEFSTSSFI